MLAAILGAVFYKALQVKDFTVLLLLNALGLIISPGVMMATAMSAASSGTNPTINILLYGCLLGIAVCLVCLLAGFILRKDKMKAIKYLRIPVIYAALWTSFGILVLTLS